MSVIYVCALVHRLTLHLCSSLSGVPARGGGERDRAGPSEGHTLCQRGHRSRGLPLLLGYGCS